MEKLPYNILLEKVDRLEEELVRVNNELKSYWGSERSMSTEEKLSGFVGKHNEIIDAYREKNEFAESILNTAQAIILVLNKEGRIVSINPFMEQLSGYASDEVTGKDWFSTFLPGGDHKKIKKVFLQAINNIQILGHINPIVIKGGEERLIEWYNKTLKDARGNVTGVLSIGHDVTERIGMEKKNEHLKKVLMAIRNVNQLIIRETDIHKLLLEACKCLTEARGFLHAWIIHEDKDKKILNAVESGVGDKFLSIIEKYKKGNYPLCVKEIQKNKDTFIRKNASGDCEHCICTDIHSNNIAMFIRMGHKDNFYGVLSVLLPSDFDVDEKEEVSLLREVAGDIALGIFNIHSQIALRESEEKYRLLTENASNMIYRRALPDGRYQYVSPSCYQITGYTQSEFYTNPSILKNILHPDWKGYIEKQWRNLSRGENLPYHEFQIIHKNGESRWLHQIDTLIKDATGRPVAVEGSINNISERKKVDEALRASERKYRNIVNHSLVGIFRSNLTGEILFANNALVKIFNFNSKEEFIKEGEIIKYKNFSDRNMLTHAMQEEGSITNFEVEVLKKDGSPIYINMNAILDGEEISGMIIDVTEKVKAEKQLIALNTQLQVNMDKYFNLFNNTGTATCIFNDDNIITLCNGKFEELTGFEKKDIEGKKTWYEFVIPKDLKRMKKYHEQRSKQAGSPPAEYGFELVDKSGTHKQIHLQIGFMKKTKERIASMIDITERKQTENALVKSEARFRAYIESSPSPIFIIDMHGSFKFVNQSALKLLGYTNNELLNLTLKKIIVAENIDEHTKNISFLLEKLSNINTELVFRTRKGEKVDVILNSIKIPGNEIIAYCTDVTKLKNVEKEMLEAKEKAEESDRLKSAFLANMSHEIRTPMNGILGFAQLLKKENIPEALKQSYIEVINAKGTQLLQLITDIIDISKIEANQVKILHKTFSLNGLLKQLELFYTTLINKENKNIKLTLSMPFPTGTDNIISDEVRLEQVLTNLLSNAFKFTDEGEISFGYMQDERKIKFFIHDTGIGISKKEQKYIFDRFMQAAETEQRFSGGTGLGLAISKGFVEKLGGEIWVESNLNKGSSFYFTIPYISGDPGSIHREKEQPTEYRWEEKVILVAEDEEINFQLIEAILEPTNASVIRARTGKEAILACIKKTKVDAVLMDIKMPEMNGLEATKEIRKTKKTLPIVAQTAYAMSTDADECLSAGCDAYISKPLDPQALLDILNRFLKE